MKKIVFVVVLVLAVVAGVIFKNRWLPYTSTFFPRLGQAAMPAETLDKYFNAAEKRRAKNPNDLQSLVDEGIVYFMRGPEHYSEALNAFNSAWQAGALDKRIFYYSGILYENLSLFNEAQKQYERFLNHEPNDYEIKMRLARLLFRMNLWEESVQKYKELLQTTPQDATSLINCGLAIQNQYDTLKKDKKTNPADLKNLRQDGISYFEKAIQTQAEMPKGLYLGLAKFYLDSENFDPALAAAEKEWSVEKELPLNAQNSEVLLTVAMAHEKLDHKEKALDFYMQLLKINPAAGNKIQSKIRILKKQLNVKK